MFVFFFFVAVFVEVFHLLVEPSPGDMDRSNQIAVIDLLLSARFSHVHTHELAALRRRGDAATAAAEGQSGGGGHGELSLVRMGFIGCLFALFAKCCKGRFVSASAKLQNLLPLPELLALLHEGAMVGPARRMKARI